MGEGTADGAGECKSRVEGYAGELLGVDGLFRLLLERVQLDAAGRRGRCCGAHCVVCVWRRWRVEWSGEGGWVLLVLMAEEVGSRE